MGIIVNFTEQTVEGFHGIKGKIDVIDETSIIFSGSDRGLGKVTGSIDRVTGDVSAFYHSSSSPEEETWKMEYSLKCKPTQRMF